MWEHSWCKAASWDMDGFVTTLNDRAADGWEVVSVIQGAPSGGDVSAVLRRERSSSDTSTATPAAVAATAAAAGATTTPDEEPAGWAAAPDSVDTTVDQAAEAADEPAPVGAVDFEPVGAAQPAAAAATTATSTTPAGWYPDPSTRFEMRYWDGGQWTEHVARGGQQFTDPPVA